MGSSGMVIDTGIFIEFLRAKNKEKTLLNLIPDTENIYLSSITLYESLMGATTSEKKIDIDLLTSDIPILPFDDESAKKAGQIYHKLRKSNKMIEFRDIFIASTAITHQLPLLTLNDKHFVRINGLTLVDKTTIS